MYEVKRAIIMAAGQGHRLQPISLRIPKPLIPVNGVPMIVTAIEGLRSFGITEIYVVVGYLKEQFRYLEDSYPGLQLIENPYYDSCNNISSLYMARDHLENAIILDGDQIIYNPAILSPEFERSGYNAVYTTAHTEEWLLTLRGGIITECSRTGGSGGYQLYSISRWNAEDGKKLKAHLELEFKQRKNRFIYWDDIPLFCHPEDYRLGIREMRQTDIVEIDSIQELALLDAHYQAYIGGTADENKSHP